INDGGSMADRGWKDISVLDQRHGDMEDRR
ncbi:hypothetical protein Tco_1147454, partial [Tanacetum coccineum]